MVKDEKVKVVMKEVNL